MTLTRTLGLFLLGIAAGGASPACDYFLVISNQDLFHTYPTVYEGTALTSDYLFEVHKTWRGDPLEWVQLHWLIEHGNECDLTRPVAVGEEYLLLLSCPSAELSNVFTCKSRIELLSDASSRLVFLDEGVDLRPVDLAEVLQKWHSDEMSTQQLSSWLSSVNLRARVSDWREIEGVSWSLTAWVVQELHSLLNEPAILLSELACELNQIRVHAIPEMLRLLESTYIAESELLAFEDLMENLYDDC